MTKRGSQDSLAKDVVDKIRDAFPDITYSGSITPADGLQNEELDEERALYSELKGKKWSQVSTSFIEANPDAVVLLTDQAFFAFLPAWLNCAITHEKVREMTAYMFEPRRQKERPPKLMDNRIRQLSSPQRKAIEALLAYCVHVEPSPYIKKSAQNALDYVTTISKN